jgi:hypothetical protein
MVNCTATIYTTEQTLDGGHRVAELDGLFRLEAGPAYLSSPSRAWQQAAAFEGQYTATLSMHTATALQDADRIKVEGHVLAGWYDVVSNSVTGANWSIGLQRRPTRAD